MTTPQRHQVLGYPLDAVTLEEAAAWVLRECAAGREGADATYAATVGSTRSAEKTGGRSPRLVVTLNPEIVVQAESNEPLATALRSAHLSVADGVGVAWAAKRAGHPLPGRVPGVELASEVLRLGAGDLKVYLLGAAEGVAARAASEVERRWGVQVVGSHHGYFAGAEATAEVCAAVRAAEPDLLLAGLGEGQERFLYEHAAQLNATVMIGVGGTLDVLAGTVKRMPAWTTKLGVEWLFRVVGDRRRWKRAPRLLRFVRLTLSQPRT